MYIMRIRYIYGILYTIGLCTPVISRSGNKPLLRSLSMKRPNIDPYPDIKHEFSPAKNNNQRKYMEVLNNPHTRVVLAVGPAGTGKTMIACNHAIKLLKSGKIERIVITRPIVPVEEEEIGFLPGNIHKKMDPWMRPITDIFLELYNQKELDRMIYDNVIEIAPLAFMRGRTFKNTFIIGDEMQNSTPNQMLMLLTRIGEGTKVAITGDTRQSDLVNRKPNGLVDVLDKTRRHAHYFQTKYPESPIDITIKIVEFEDKDIERSKVVRKIIDVYNIETILEKSNYVEMIDPPSEKTLVASPASRSGHPLGWVASFDKATQPVARYIAKNSQRCNEDDDLEYMIV